MLTDVKNILPLTLIQRERVLPVPGRVVVRQGQNVSPTDVVAECSIAPRYFMLDVADGLNVSPDKADILIKRKMGEEIIEGDLIAGPIGMFQRVVRSPYSGLIKFIGDGKVLLEVTTAPFELMAGMEGHVAKIIPDQGVIIETGGALVQGMWGNEKIDFGMMHNLLTQPDDSIDSGLIDVSMRGMIVLAGYCRDPEVLQDAANAPVKGLILSSMCSSLIPLALEMPFPVVVVDGFGRKSLNSRAFKLLTTIDKDRDVALNAQAFQPSRGIKPEIIVSLPAPDRLEPPLEKDELIPGGEIYLVNQPYQGQTAKLVRILSKPYRFQSGIQTRAAEVRLDDNHLAVVPVENIISLGRKSKQEYY